MLAQISGKSAVTRDRLFIKKTDRVCVQVTYLLPPIVFLSTVNLDIITFSSSMHIYLSQEMS